MHSVGRGSRVIRWMAGIAVAALLVGGGVALGADLTAGNATTRAGLTLVSSPAIASTAHSTGRTDDLAGLRTCLAAARQVARSGHHGAAQAKRHACRREYHARGLLRRLLRLRLRRMLLRWLILASGEHGRTVAFERGVIQTASSGAVAVRAADGTTLTWHRVSRTAIVRVQHRGKNRTIDRVSASALAAGQRVFVVGAVVGGTDIARLIIIRG